MYYRKSTLIIVLTYLFLNNYSQVINEQSLIRSFKPLFDGSIEYTDLDSDGDPDLIHSTIFDTISVYWVDDDDDMKDGDREGDLDNDCLIIDRNNDGIFAGAGDLSIDWVDNNNDGIADMQVVVENSNPHITGYWDWSSNYMWIIDTEQDEQFNYINWKTLVLKCWSHYGASNFYEDYHGQTLFQKVSVPSYRFSDVRYSWENPFLFYDPDNDGLTEMAIRLVDECNFRKRTKNDVDTYPNKKITEAYLTFDLDNDNAPSNEFDFDMSLFFAGPGFSYEDQVHKYENIKGLKEADSLFFDHRWREIDELIYPDHESAWDLTFYKGEWDYCWFVFDEDDDCERWERVELYKPKNPFIIGMQQGGIDDNPQADASGDRGEWDLDNSGNGKLYIGFDGRIHLFGAEKGYWRIDQDANSYQGWGGLYETGYKRDQRIPEKFATIAYEDTNNDGFFNLIRFDLDGDTIYESSFNLEDYNIKATYALFDIESKQPSDVNKLFEHSANIIWNQAMQAVEAAKSNNINYKWYSLWLNPKSLEEKYRFGYWIQFYLFFDFLEKAKNDGDSNLRNSIIQSYFSGKWEDITKP